MFDFGYATPMYSMYLQYTTIPYIILYYPVLIGDYFFRTNLPDVDNTLQCWFLRTCYDREDEDVNIQTAWPLLNGHGNYYICSVLI